MVLPMRWHAWLRSAAVVSVWALAVGCLAFAVVRAFGLERRWGGYTLIAFTPYAALGALVPLVSAVALRRWFAAAVALVAAVVFGFVLTPRAFGGADPARGPELRLMSVNMKIGAADAATVMRLATQNRVDVLVIQEFTPEADSALIAAGLGRALPYSTANPHRYAAGSGLFSRYPLTDTGHTALPHAFSQAYAVVHVPGAQPVYVRSVHPTAPSGPNRIPLWRRDLAAQPPADPHGQIRILAGDFNATLDHALLRRLIATGYRDAASRLGDGFTTTWPYDGRPVPRVTLDHVLVDSRVGVSSFAAHRISGTDHRSIIVTLTLPPSETT
jgi:endonuclease/exonuclease/phosphatase (EEP) superfamily protein YafD